MVPPVPDGTRKEEDNMKNFKDVLDNNYERLEQYVPVVSRVHGGSHPEFDDVEKVYKRISTKEWT